MRFDLTTALSALLLIPYFGWGLYVLRERFRHDADLNHAIEIATLVGLALFYVIEIALLRSAMRETPVFLFFAILGLVVSSAALYGSMLISLLSYLIVESVMPGSNKPVHEPRLGPAEALERQGDYEGAVKEYMVIARVFPGDPTPAVRIGDNLMKLDRPQEATERFERGLARLNSPQKSLLIANRLFDIYLRHLDEREKALRVLEDYAAKFPNAEQTVHVTARLQSLKQPPVDLSEPEEQGLGIGV